jgi:hypothetical protein
VLLTERQCVSERVLSRIFGVKREEVTGSWRTFHNEECHSFTSSTKYSGDTIKEE